LRELKERGTAVLLVTHDTQSVRLLCDRAIWLDSGRIHLEGDPATVVNEYLRHLHAGEPSEPVGMTRTSVAAPEPAHPPPETYAYEVDLGLHHARNSDVVRWGRGGARLIWAGLTGEDTGAVALRHGERLKLSVLFECDSPPPGNLSVAFTILHRKSLELIYESTSASGLKIDVVHANRPLRADFEFDNILAADDYSVALALWCDVDGHPEYLDFVSGVLPFKVVSDTVVHGLVRPRTLVRLEALSS
jgi:lipopolysaccharide transport system ATP-binding protein